MTDELDEFYRITHDIRARRRLRCRFWRAVGIVLFLAGALAVFGFLAS